MSDKNTEMLIEEQFETFSTEIERRIRLKQVMERLLFLLGYADE